jgi:hypothetical protein
MLWAIDQYILSGFSLGVAFKRTGKLLIFYGNVSPVSMILAKCALPESMIPVKHMYITSDSDSGNACITGIRSKTRSFNIFVLYWSVRHDLSDVVDT